MHARHQALAERVENLGEPRILVLGDLILDRYVWGNAERISQEAPVILLRADKREERLGGAASVSMMLTALGARVHLAGILGDDAAGARCRQLLDDHHIHHELVLADPSRPSTLKERYIGRAQQRHPQQMMRVDYEVRDAIDDVLADRLSTSIIRMLDDCDILLVSDYDKGVCTPRLLGSVIASCRSRGIRVIVDPIRGGDYPSRYRHVTTMTPNRLEASLATGIDIADHESALRAADVLRETLGMDAGIVTLDRDGMAIANGMDLREVFPVRARDVYDITGAGDMVLAVLGMTLASGADYPDAITIANIAGGLEVERIGVATITREEIIRDLLQSHPGTPGKIVSPDTLVGEVRRRRAQGESIVFTNGCFDILHAGHVQYLKDAKSQGDVLIVGMNTDASVRRLGKGSGRPINGEEQRAHVLAALECVDYVCLFDEDTPLHLITLVQPDVLVKGQDYTLSNVVGREIVEARGGRVYLAPLVKGKSTTSILEKIRNEKAA